jgi:hypothetical protein
MNRSDSSSPDVVDLSVVQLYVSNLPALMTLDPGQAQHRSMAVAILSKRG